MAFFQDTAKGAMKKQQPQKMPRGRPQEHLHPVTKVTVVLLDKQIHWLDRLASDIRLNTKTAISRTEILRAFISAIEESGIDLSECKSEREVKDKLFQDIRGAK